MPVGRSLLTLTFALSGFVSLAAQETSQTTTPPKAIEASERLEKSPRHHEWVSLTTEAGKKVRAFVVFPEVDRPTAAVLVIHENRGLNDWARSLADQVAEAGYVAIAPDMLTGKGIGGGGTDSFDSPDAARTAIYELSSDEVRQALDAAAKYARGLDSTTDTVAVAGFCWGGGQAFDYAAHNPDIAGAFVFYGTAPPTDRLQQVGAPVYGFYGGNDFRITGQVPEVSEAMEQAGKTYKPEVYEGAGHGFMRSGEAEDAKPADVQGRNQAWQRWLGILSQLDR